MTKEKVYLHVLIFITITLWASAFVAVRFAITDYNPGSMALLRYLTASVVLLPIALKKRIKFPAKNDLIKIISMGLLGITLYNIFFNEGLRSITAGSASFLINTVPLFTSALAFFFLKEKLSFMRWAGLIISLVGVSLVAVGERGTVEINIGAALLLSAALCQAAYIIIQKNLLKKYTGFELGVYTIWTGTLFLLGYFSNLYENLSTSGSPSTISIIYLGIFPAAVGYLAWSMALQLAPASYVVTFLYIVPLLTLIISKIWINETPVLLSLIGGVIVIAGVVIANIKFKS